MEAAATPPLVKIEKEYVNNLVFPKHDVLATTELQAMRAKKIKRATTLGNLEKHKVQIDFQDLTGMKRVETTIWSITEQYILLKSNRHIPIHCVVDIKML